jgi:hypothetical protein
MRSEVAVLVAGPDRWPFAVGWFAATLAESSAFFVFAVGAIPSLVTLAW